MPFCGFLCFGNDVKDNTVVIQHRHNGNFNQFKSLRIAGNNDRAVAHNGGKGEFAHWHIERKGGNKCKIKSTKTGRYLRVHGVGHNLSVDCAGLGPAFCEWKVHHHGQGQHAFVKLEAEHKAGKYLAVKDDGVFVGGGGDHCKLKVFVHCQ